MERALKKKNPRYYSRYLAHYTKRNITLIMLGILFLLGTLSGTILLRSSSEETLALLFRIVNGYAEKRAGQSLADNLISAACSNLAFLLVLFLCGFCAVAHPVEALIPFCRGLGYGFSVGSLYASHGARAIGFTALYMLPPMLFSTTAILLCCVESLRLSSVLFFALGKPDERKRGDYSIRIYLARFFSAAFLCLFAALLESALFALFAKKVILG